MLDITKGKWEVTKGLKIVGGLNYTQAVADVFGATEEEQEANAHLIAKSPQMYEWIERVIKQGIDQRDINEAEIFLKEIKNAGS
ncbi:hypothetical protein LCGC14_1452510 [marine sediment metagenome]|uniref:Uncharacterized protein n=1 Tax=marine sediment metagenome TaxID=412755 RepID=A0A0F9JHF8_9ZZZZ|nr:hypothetical protein [Pricia sp.]